MPPCICGEDEYKAEAAGEGFHNVCQACGRHFKLERGGSRVFLVDGEQRECYMKKVKRRGWIAADGE